jgi:hypothetical protein
MGPSLARLTLISVIALLGPGCAGTPETRSGTQEKALGVGGAAGGALAFAKDENSGKWLGPAFYDITQASIGSGERRRLVRPPERHGDARAL